MNIEAKKYTLHKQHIIIVKRLKITSNIISLTINEKSVKKTNKDIQRITKPAEIAARINTSNINNTHDHRHFIYMSHQLQ